MPQSEFWPDTISYSNKNVDHEGDASHLQKQLGDMEGEVKEIQKQLAAIKRNRQDLHENSNIKNIPMMPELDGVFYGDETYSDDVNKSLQVINLQEELVKAKNAAEEEKNKREKYESKLKDLELKLNHICDTEIVAHLDLKDHRKISDEEINALKSQVRNMNDEMEEMRTIIVEKTEQMQDYRVKYLQAQQQVEELKRELDVIEYDNKQVSDQIQIEIQKMKVQFQEKLQELTPLPDLLKGAQIQLQEAQQIQRLAEDSSQQLSIELHDIKEKLVIAVNNFNNEKGERIKKNQENKILNVTLEEKQREILQLTKNLEDSKCMILRLEEKLHQKESSLRDKTVEYEQIAKDLSETRDEAKRSMTRCKDRAEAMRRYLQTQISEMERQLVQSRAQCKSCQKERDGIRKRIQTQVAGLQENFELAEIRLRALQRQVTTLKKSHSMILIEDEHSTDYKITTTETLN